MKQIISFVLISSLAISSYTPLLAPVAESATTAFQFQRTLKLGDNVDPDVKYLQQVLNSNLVTRVADTGPGSNDQLTTYFGQKTKDAVIRFQNIYKSEILDPSGLTVGNGIVGPATRKKLNAVISQTTSADLVYISYATNNNSGANNSSLTNSFDGSSSSIDPSTIIPAPASAPSKSSTVPAGYIKITGLSSYKAVPGQVISIFGQGFADEGNTVYVGSTRAGSGNSLNKGTSVSFTVPNVPKSGTYQIAIDNYFGTINSGNIVLTVQSDSSTDSSSNTNNTVVSGQTTLNSVSPKTSSNINDIVTLTGTNFTANNTIQTNLGNLVMPSTDSKTISFLIGSLPYYQQAFDLYKGQSINVTIRVSNENGKSDNQITHVINFPNTKNPSVNSSPQFSLDNSIYSTNITASSTSSSTTQSVDTPFGTISASGNTPGDSALAKYVSSFDSPSSGTSSGSGSSGVNAGASANTSATNSTDQILASNKNNNTDSSSGLGAGAAILGVGALGLGIAGLGGAAAGSGAAIAGVGTAAGAGAAGLVAAPFFGGKLLAIIPCTCSANFLLTIFDLTQNRPMLVMYAPGISALKPNYSLRPGVSIIGGFTRAPAACLMKLPIAGCYIQSYAEGIVDFVRGAGTTL